MYRPAVASWILALALVLALTTQCGADSGVGDIAGSPHSSIRCSLAPTTRFSSLILLSFSWPIQRPATRTVAVVAGVTVIVRFLSGWLVACLQQQQQGQEQEHGTDSRYSIFQVHG